MSNWPFGLLAKSKYSVIYADPPWGFETFKRDLRVPQHSTAHADMDHYSVMSTKGMAELPVNQLATPDCALFMWTTASHTPQAFWLAQKWGFRFASKSFTWAKLNKNAIIDEKRVDDESAFFMGMGYGTRRNTEDCWLFTKGKPKRQSKGVRELIVSPIREHSRKPDETYGRIEALFDGPYCELFGRSTRAGWSTWGNETDKFT